MEKWKNIIDNPTYSISDIGRVRNNKTGRILKLFKNNLGYMCLRIPVNNNKKGYRIARLVASHFIGEIPDGLVVDHINRCRDDNKLDNLRIVTKENNLLNRGNNRRYLIERIINMYKDGKSVDDIVTILDKLRNI